MQPAFDYLSTLTGCAPDSHDVLDCLRTQDASVINTSGWFVSFPIADGSYVNTQSLVTLLHTGQISKVPLLLHNDQNEGSIYPFFSGLTGPESSKAFMKSFVPFFTLDQKNMKQKLWPYSDYPASPAGGNGGDFFADLVLRCPSRLTAKVYSAAGLPVYYTGMTKPPFNNVFAGAGVDFGVYHGADIPFVWKVPGLIERSEKDIGKNIRGDITDFASGRLGAMGMSSFSAGGIHTFSTGGIIAISKIPVKINVTLSLGQSCDFLHPFNRDI
jgi:carboxylesterase type B